MINRVLKRGFSVGVVLSLMVLPVLVAGQEHHEADAWPVDEAADLQPARVGRPGWEAGGDVIGADWRTPLDGCRAILGKETAIQGNLDPVVLETAPWREIRGHVDEILQQAVDVVGEIPAEIHTELIEGDPAEAIIEVAKTRASNVIVMGSRGLGRLAGLVLGSTSQKVVSHAPCPVLIVR